MTDYFNARAGNKLEHKALDGRLHRRVGRRLTTENEMNDTAKCVICGEPMPVGEEMFKYHGYSGDCPKPPLPKQPVKQKIPGLVWAVAVKDNRKVSMIFYTNEQAMLSLLA